MSKRFAGKSALVTGAASGIGRASAKRLGSEGATLVLADINLEGAEMVARAIRDEYGVAATTVHFDARQPKSCREMVDKAVAALGRLDVLLNIAGIFNWNHTTDFDDDAGTILSASTSAAVPYLKARPAPSDRTKGNIVNASSTAGLKGQAYCAAYCAAKHGVVGLTKALAVEYAGKGVRVNAVCPGGVATALSDKVIFHQTFDLQLLSLVNSKLNNGAMADAEEIAAIFAYLASEDAKYITGSAYAIDGGQLAG